MRTSWSSPESLEIASPIHITEVYFRGLKGNITIITIPAVLRQKGNSTPEVEQQATIAVLEPNLIQYHQPFQYYHLTPGCLSRTPRTAAQYFTERTIKPNTRPSETFTRPRLHCPSAQPLARFLLQLPFLPMPPTSPFLLLHR